MQEVRNAIRDLSLGHAASTNGIPTEFFKWYVEVVEADLLEAVKEVLTGGELSKSHNRGIIAFIPKGADVSMIKNFRPITLLSLFYKPVAKVLANCLKRILLEVVRPNQIGFVLSRCIIDNIFMAQEAMIYVEESWQNLTLLLLDFKKAYNRISWGFIQIMLEKQGFHESFICKVMLYRNTSSIIIVNGVVEEEFKLSQSVRQGYPLASFLFVVVIDALGYMLEDPSLLQRIIHPTQP